MSTPLRTLLLCAILTVPAIALGQINIVNFDFGAVPILCQGDYAYEGPILLCSGVKDPEQNFNAAPGFGWFLGSAVISNGPGSGLTGPNTAFDPPSFADLPFTQAVFLQAIAWVSQSVAGFNAGNYTLSFYLGSRYTSGMYDGNQTVQALIDGHVIGTWALSSFTPFTLETASFTVTTAGAHTLEFRGITPGDHTAFLSYVVITPTDR
ncbi:MAG TPA: hypothetical protein VMD98_11235 [Bryocella sp.]|nr:hypothetical protein [Bryocella sp.]